MGSAPSNPGSPADASSAPRSSWACCSKAGLLPSSPPPRTGPRPRPHRPRRARAQPRAGRLRRRRALDQGTANDWITTAALSFIGAGIILHVGIGLRWRFALNTKEEPMSTEEPSNPAVRMLVAAINSGDRDGFPGDPHPGRHTDRRRQPAVTERLDRQGGLLRTRPPDHRM